MRSLQLLPRNQSAANWTESQLIWTISNTYMHHYTPGVHDMQAQSCGDAKTIMLHELSCTATVWRATVVGQHEHYKRVTHSEPEPGQMRWSIHHLSMDEVVRPDGTLWREWLTCKARTWTNGMGHTKSGETAMKAIMRHVILHIITCCGVASKLQ